MQYLLCPRCQFRVALNRHICGTCGLAMPSLKQLQGEAEIIAQASQAKKGKLWSSFFGLTPRGSSIPNSEHGHEEPALG